VKVQVQHCSPVSPDTKEKGMTKIHLTGETGQQVPAGCKNGEYTGQNQNSQEIRILRNHRQSKQYQKEYCDNHATGENEDLAFYNGN
jgi:hypothetical protein